MGHVETLQRELLIHHYLAEGESRREERARKGAPPEVAREPETKRDVNLARKTLFSPGKVVNGRLGSRLPIVRRVGARIAYELVLQDKSEPSFSFATLRWSRERRTGLLSLE